MVDKEAGNESERKPDWTGNRAIRTDSGMGVERDWRG